jgi:tRNA (cmo5U34)-methyltransferase
VSQGSRHRVVADELPAPRHRVVADELPAPRHPSTAEGWDPRTYPAFTAAIGPIYEELQDAVVDATRDRDVASILDLGTGTGVTARRLLSAHEGARVVGIDANQAMLDAAARALPPEKTTLVRGRLEDPLPPGPFDLVVSVLAVHHLNSPGKADLFARINDVLSPTGRFVLGDSVCDPQAPKPKSTAGRLSRSLRDDGMVETTRKLIRRARHKVSGEDVGYDEPDLVVDQISWLTSAGLRTRVVWEKQLCAVVTADKVR